MKKHYSKMVYYRPFIIFGIGLALYIAAIFTMFVISNKNSARVAFESTLNLEKTIIKESVDNFIIDLEQTKNQLKHDSPEMTDKEIEDTLFKYIYTRLHSEQYQDGTYMWIEKVLNYDGGDNYAIRLVHPNLSETEGDFLSTNEINPVTNTRPYKEELDGIIKDGSVYIEYAFKELNSEKISPKICYSKLYKDYDWIICMGINQQDLQHYQAAVIEGIKPARMVFIFLSILLLIILMLAILLSSQQITANRFKERELALLDQLNKDSLTHAIARSLGENILKKEFSNFKNGKPNTVIAMLDIDHFKLFNDEYGHAVGDQVLIDFVNVIKKTTRTTDSIIRWGGDEFILVLEGVSLELIEVIASKVQHAISTIHIKGVIEDVTVSIGFTYFSESDSSYKDTLNRADESLYIIKQSGRNNWRLG